MVQGWGTQEFIKEPHVVPFWVCLWFLVGEGIRTYYSEKNYIGSVPVRNSGHKA